MLDIRITKADPPKAKPDGPLGFGKIFTDHMFMMDYHDDRGWHDARIVPYGDLILSPASMVLHYGQEMFEGMKAYKGPGGENYLFRPEMNAYRTNATNDRMCIPQIPVEDFMQALQTLIRLEADWIPTGSGASLYIRPFIFAADPYMGVGISKSYVFMIILSPSSEFFGGCLSSVSIWIEDEYVRAVRGGTGSVKTGGNYAASYAAMKKASSMGFDQVMWLDAIERKYIEEVGTMNIFFKIGERVLTPELNESILAGVTRDSVLRILRDWGYVVEERLISVEELIAAQKSGELEEVFGCGTAVVIAPVGKLRYKDELMQIKNGKPGPLSQKLYDTLTGIQRGTLDDKFGWRIEVK